MSSSTDTQQEETPVYTYRHLLGIEGLTRFDIEKLLDLADEYVETNRQADKKHAILRGRTLINMFFEIHLRQNVRMDGLQLFRRRISIWWIPGHFLLTVKSVQDFHMF